MKTTALILAILLLGAGPAFAEKKAAKKPVKIAPEIGIGFDDDASSLVISNTWVEDGVEMKETYSFGKDIYLNFIKKNGDWVRTKDFKSKNWEAYLTPDLTGFLLMEREYSGKRFENLSLRIFEYSPKRKVRFLRPANGTPYWSPSGEEMAMVEKEDDNRINVTIYNIHKGSVTKVKRGLTRKKFEKMLYGFLRARVCDDEVPCDPEENMELIKERQRKGR